MNGGSPAAEHEGEPGSVHTAIIVQQSPRLVGPFRSGAGFRQALARARDEAFLRFHRQVHPGHILLAVALTPDARVDAVLATLGIAREALAERAAARLPPPLAAHDGGPDLAYTPRGGHVLEQATRLAEGLGWGWLGAAHLLVALGEEDWGPAPRVFREAGVTPAALHSALATAARSIPPPMSDEPPIYGWIPVVPDAPGSNPPVP